METVIWVCDLMQRSKDDVKAVSRARSDANLFLDHSEISRFHAKAAQSSQAKIVNEGPEITDRE